MNTQIAAAINLVGNILIGGNDEALADFRELVNEVAIQPPQPIAIFQHDWDEEEDLDLNRLENWAQVADVEIQVQNMWLEDQEVQAEINAREVEVQCDILEQQPAIRKIKDHFLSNKGDCLDEIDDTIARLPVFREEPYLHRFRKFKPRMAWWRRPFFFKECGFMQKYKPAKLSVDRDLYEYLRLEVMFLPRTATTYLMMKDKAKRFVMQYDTTGIRRKEYVDMVARTIIAAYTPSEFEMLAIYNERSRQVKSRVQRVHQHFSVGSPKS